MACIEDIPDELLDIVILKLVPPPTAVYTESQRSFSAAPDKSDLSAVSLVSHRWRACALPYLFGNMSVQQHPDCATDPSHMLRGLQHLLRESKNLRLLLDFLRSHPFISSYVEHLSIRPAFTCPDALRTYALSWRTYMEKLVIPAELLLQTIESLPSLRILVLVDLEFTLPVGNLANVETLYIGQAYKRADPFKTLACFRKIKELHVVASFPCDPISVSSKLFRNLTIQSFSAHGEVLFPLYSTLFQSSECASSLMALSFYHAYMEKTVEGMHEFFLAFASQLVQLVCHLSLLESMTTGAPSQLYITILEGAVWPKLEHLTVHFHLDRTLGSYTSRRNDGRVWTFMISFLRAFASCPNLRTLVLVMEISRPGHSLLSHIESLKAVESVLLGFVDLKSVILTSGPMGTPLNASQSDLLRDTMSTLYQRGVLRVTT